MTEENIDKKIGYVYCFSNECMPGILKVGMTERKPEDRLRDANRANTWTPPTPYKVEMAKQVYYPKQKEMAIHKLLDIYGKRINPKREFFRSNVDEIRSIFDIIDGEYYYAKEVDKELDIEKDDTLDDEMYINDTIDANDEDRDSVILRKEKKEEKEIKKDEKKDEKKDIKKVLSQGQRVRHTVFDTNNIWIGTYDSGKIISNSKQYKTISDFVKAHYKNEKIEKFNNNNVLNETECEINDEWVVISSIF